MATTRKVFDASFNDPGLNVRARISDVSSGMAVFVTNVVMVEDEVGTYYGTYLFDDMKIYLVQPRVYTDNTYTTVDPNYSAASTSINSSSAESIAPILDAINQIRTMLPTDLVAQIDDDLITAIVNDDTIRIS